MQLQTSDTVRFEHEHAGTYISLNRTTDTVRFEHEHAGTSVSTVQETQCVLSIQTAQVEAA